MTGHIPVLYHEIIHALQPRRGGLYVDGTLGAGGHAWGILQASSPDGRLLGLDLDPHALALAAEKLAPFGERAILVHASYRTLAEQLQRLGWAAVDGILLDLGVSSMQLDAGERGFSFLVDAPLDMRFDPTSPLSAADLVNSLGEAELADIIYRYGEERYARQVARAIVRSRPLHTTRQLAELVARVVGSRKTAASSARGGGRIHPATRTFQALRIAVNDELEVLRSGLSQATSLLIPGGRLAVISFHSLEDRIVKNFFSQESRQCICLAEQLVCTCGHRATLHIITQKPITATRQAISINPRARSAKLRVAEYIEE